MNDAPAPPPEDSATLAADASDAQAEGFRPPPQPAPLAPPSLAARPEPAIPPPADGRAPGAQLEPVAAGAGVAASVARRPELVVAGAFAGGVLVALILKRIAT